MQGKHGVYRQYSVPRMILGIIVCGWLGLGGLSQPVMAYSYELSGPDRVVREGYFRLTALATDSSHDREPFIVQMSDTQDFSVIRATFSPLGNFNRLSLSGFDDGVYYFRLSTASADNTDILSESIRVEVSHYPLSRALTLFVVGAVLFISLVVLIGRFWWRDHCAARGARHG